MMSRIRSAGIVIKDGKVLVIRRISGEKEYYVFPGGGVEQGETPEQAAFREIAEETSITVVSKQCVYHITWDTGEENFFYLCEYISGEPYLSEDSEEFEKMKEGTDSYEPMWVPIDTVPNLILYQLEIRDLFLHDYRHGFLPSVQELFITFSDRRQ